MRNTIVSVVVTLFTLICPTSAFAYLHLDKSRQALVGNPGDCDICSVLGPSRGPYQWKTYYRYSESRLRNRIVYGPGYACYAVFESTGSDNNISDYLIKNVCVA